MKCARCSTGIANVIVMDRVGAGKMLKDAIGRIPNVTIRRPTARVIWLIKSLQYFSRSFASLRLSAVNTFHFYPQITPVALSVYTNNLQQLRNLFCEGVVFRTQLFTDAGAFHGIYQKRLFSSDNQR